MTTARRTFDCWRYVGLMMVAAASVWAGSPAGQVPGATGEDQVVVMRPFEVQIAVLGSIGVRFTLNGDDADDLAAQIVWASLTDVPAGGPGARAGLKAGDELIRLNDRLIRGLTIPQLAGLIRRNRERGNLVWTVRRGVLGVTFTTVFNGKPESEARSLSRPTASPRLLQGRTNLECATGVAPSALPPLPLAATQVELMEPFSVRETWTEAIEVRFMLSGKNLTSTLDDPMREANIASVQGVGAGTRQGLQTGDVLVRLNGTALQGLTIRQLGALVAGMRKKGDLVWEVRRGLTFFSRRYNGKWTKPLPLPAGS